MNLKLRLFERIMQRRNRNDDFDRRLKMISFVIFVLFLIVTVYGANLLLKEMKTISEGQKVLFSALTKNRPVGEGDVSKASSGDYVSKKEFIKFKNENRKTMRIMARQLRSIQNRLKIKKTVLDRY